MEWSKSAMSKAELEKKQREFMEQAVRMAKKAGHDSQKKEMTHIPAPVHEIEPPAEEISETAEEIMEEAEEAAEELEELTEEIEELSEVFTEEAEDIAEEPPVSAEEPAEETSYGVFGADELAQAIEKGEVSGEGLRQAAEMLAEMTRKTEEMKKLLKEQEQKSVKTANGADIGLNSYIDRHNKGCRGCSNGKPSSS